jgi:anti-sigma regulatory factor (Ser/Thr protein kinase)
MTAPAIDRITDSPGALEHDALFYTGDDDYRSGVLDFVRDGLSRDEPVLVAVPGTNVDLLRDGLAPDEAPRVRLRDMAVAGRNPGRIIGTVLSEFVAEHPGRRVRIVGEPIWAGRTDEEYPACAEHEALINVALGDAAAHILCPYDTGRLPGSVLTDATRTHPRLAAGGERWTSPAYADPAAVAASFDAPLPPVPPDADMLVVRASTGPRAARVLVHEVGRAHGMSAARLADVRLVTQELTVNTLTHSGGAGLLQVWAADGHLVVQVQDGGRIGDPLVGRRRPGPPEEGHGLFVVHQHADLVRVHREPDGTTVRAWFRLADQPSPSPTR